MTENPKPKAESRIPPRDPKTKLLGIDAELFGFAAGRLRKKERTKDKLAAVAQVLKGVNPRDFIDVAVYFLNQSKMPGLSLKDVSLMGTVLREGYRVRDIQLAIDRAKEVARKSGGTLAAFAYVLPSLELVVSDPVRRDARVGGGN